MAPPGFAPSAVGQLAPKPAPAVRALARDRWALEGCALGQGRLCDVPPEVASSVAVAGPPRVAAAVRDHPQPETARTPSDEGARPRALALGHYVVQAGDTVREIAQRFGLSNETIIWANDLANPDLLLAGTELLIPPVDGVVHHVQPGDTVADIAAYYGAKTEDVIEANGLRPPYIITIDQLLLVPGGKMPLPVVPPPPAQAPPQAPADTVQEPPSTSPVQSAAIVERPLPSPPAATESQAAFILSIARAAQASQRETGVPASVTLAQAILETYWGSSRLAREANNYFGIKARERPGSAGVVWYSVWEHIAGSDTVQNEPFRAYADLQDSFIDHGRFFAENGRYAAAMEHRSDPRAFAHLIAAAGYATDPSYASKLIGLMDRFNLYAYDLDS